MEQNRFRSWVVWAAVVAQVVSILVALAVVDPEQADAVKVTTAALLQLLVIFGVLNNPTDGGGF